MHDHASCIHLHSESGDGNKGDFIRGFSDWPKTLVRESPFFHWLIGVV